MTISPKSAVATPSANRATTIAPQVKETRRLFQTSAMLVPIAVRASVRSFSSMGIENGLIADEKAANSPQHRLPTTTNAQTAGRGTSADKMSSTLGKGNSQKKRTERRTEARTNQRRNKARNNKT